MSKIEAPWRNGGRYKCPKCKSTRLVKDGRTKGKQRFKCKKCGKVSTKPYGLRGKPSDG